MNKIRRDMPILVCRPPGEHLISDAGERDGPRHRRARRASTPGPSPAAWRPPTPRTSQSLSACWSVGAGSATRSEVEIRPLSKYNALIPA